MRVSADRTVIGDNPKYSLGLLTILVIRVISICGRSGLRRRVWHRGFSFGRFASLLRVLTLRSIGWHNIDRPSIDQRSVDQRSMDERNICDPRNIAQGERHARAY